VIGEGSRQRISLDDRNARILVESAAQAGGQMRVELDGDHATRDLRELTGKRSGPGSDLDDEIVAGGAGEPDEIVCRTTTEEVLARWGPGSPRAWRGHGASP